MTGPLARVAPARLSAAILNCVLLATSLTAFWPGQTQAAPAAPIAPDWTLESISGQKISFHDQLAKGPVVISFWATWCKPCLKELPHLDRLAATYAGRATVLAVSTDASKSVAKVAPFIQSKGYENLTVLLDSGAELQNLLQVGSVVPFLLVFDRHGREIYRHLGYKDGDEIELERQLAAALAAPAAPPATTSGGPSAWTEAVTASDRFEYSYSSKTREEIFENWLDVSYQFAGFRTGILFNSQAPGEEGGRTNEITHRFLEFSSGDFDVRAGHFYGLYGRGLVFNAYEDRTVRVDTRLDGLAVRYGRDRVTAAVFSGTPAARNLDLRAFDAEYRAFGALHVGATGLTYRPDSFEAADGKVHRESVTALRVRENFSFGDFYLERGWKTGYDFDPLDDGADPGDALYANLNLYRGPFSVSWEYSDYKRFEVVSRADGVTALNRPPALASEFTWTLLNRAPHVLNVNDEKGRNLDLMYNGAGWSLLASGADIKRHDGQTSYQLGYFSAEKSRLGDFRLLGAFGYQDSDGLRQTMAGEVTWFAADTRSLSLQAEQQHVRVGGGVGFDLGTYDQQWFKLEYETAPRWAFAAILELNNKYEDQRRPDEPDGPFPAGQITYTLSRGGNVNLWFGQRQAGFLCSGGVCKFEPEFEGVEVFGAFRY